MEHYLLTTSTMDMDQELTVGSLSWRYVILEASYDSSVFTIIVNVMVIASELIIDMYIWIFN